MAVGLNFFPPKNVLAMVLAKAVVVLNFAALAWAWSRCSLARAESRCFCRRSIWPWYLVRCVSYAAWRASRPSWRKRLRNAASLSSGDERMPLVGLLKSERVLLRSSHS